MCHATSHDRKKTEGNRLIRSVKVTLKFATAAKRRRLAATLREVRSATNFFVASLWGERGKLDSETMGRFDGGSLSYRHRSNCLKVALETVVATKRAEFTTGKRVACPRVTGAVRLSSLVCRIESGRGSFDYVLKVSSLVPGKVIVIPFKSHRRLRYWLSQPGAVLKQGATVGETTACLWIELPEYAPVNGRPLGIDVGVNKLLADSDGNFYGKEMREKMLRVRCCRPGSRGKLRAIRARTHYINFVVKQLPWSDIGVIGIEDLRNIKRGKCRNRGKTFRKAMAPWTVRQVTARIEQLAQEHRVRLVRVDPKGTSRTCPRCGWEANENRVGERFCCVRCNYSSDADSIGATNVLVRTIGNSQESMVPESLLN